MSKSQLGLRIPTSLFNELDRYVEKTGTSKTEVVSRAIAEYLGCADNVPLSQRVAELERRFTEIENVVKKQERNNKLITKMLSSAEQNFYEESTTT